MRDIVMSFLFAVEAFFILYMILYSSFLFLSVAVGSSDLYALKRRKRLENELSNDYYVPVSILVPAHNEEVTIEATVRSLLALDYKLYEIVVVDDGSTDRTTELLRDAFQMWRIERPIQRQIPCQPEEEVYETRAYKVPITLVRKKNGGKADTLNMGINVSSYPYFVCLDADSVLQHDSLEKIVRPVLEDGSVVAVGGTVRPCNGAEIENGRVIRYRMPRNLLAAMQVLEYDRSFLASRILFDRFNGNIIISGAFGLFLKSVVIAAGGYDAATMGEDIPAAIRHFGKMGKIYFVHFRDVQGDRTNFHETFHDDGKTDMYEAMRCYYEVGFDGIARPDHVPTMVGEDDAMPSYGLQGNLFAVGYIKGLMEAVEKEMGLR